MSETVVTRFSPSPTGKLHIGSIRTALISFIVARQSKGSFILRIEDTDKVRSTKESEQEIYDTFEWLGIQHDNKDVVRQTEQTDEYATIIELLLKAGYVYRCNCTVDQLKEMKIRQIKQKAKRIGYEGTCRDAHNSEGTVRFNAEFAANQLGLLNVTFDDKLFGYRRTNFRDINDVVLMRTDGSATYLLANTADDVMAGVNYVTRGADLLPQTATQMLLAAAIRQVLNINKKPTEYLHLPLVLGESREKLSKRNDSTKSILDYRAEGILPNAIMQFILGLGNGSISYSNVMDLDAIIKEYDVEKLRKINTSFAEHTLLYINKSHMQSTDSAELRRLLHETYESDVPVGFIDIYKYRCATLKDLRDKADELMPVIHEHKDKLHNLKKEGFPADKCCQLRTEVFNGKSTAPLDELVELAG